MSGTKDDDIKTLISEWEFIRDILEDDLQYWTEPKENLLRTHNIRTVLNKIDARLVELTKRPYNPWMGETPLRAPWDSWLRVAIVSTEDNDRSAALVDACSSLDRIRILMRRVSA